MNAPVQIALWMYFVAISLVSSAVTVRDKHAAMQGERRVRENTLMILSALGGSVAMLLTMLAVRHKTRHVKFMAGIPIIILFQAILAAWLAMKIR